MISIKFQSNFIQITLRHGCYCGNLLHIFRIPFPKNTTEGLLLLVTGSLSALKNFPVSEILKVETFKVYFWTIKVS